MPRRIAYRFDTGASGTAPAVVWLSGFLSDMGSTKVQYLSDWAARQGYAMLRFDYSGHGLSGGDIEKASVGDWLEEARTMLEHVGERPVVLVGSSLGGWISLLLARAMARSGYSRLQGLVLIAPAWDMTEKLMWEKMGEKSRNAVLTEGVFYAPSNYDDPYPITKILIEEGRNHLLASGGIEVNAPVRILQGMRDEDVPWEHARALVDLLATDDVDLTLVKTGDHRLSKPEDLERLSRTIQALIDGTSASA
ncbi:alpha/beta fold hydrolase [Methyloceanibacter sp.]|uniref:alpha/beta hydrolase n=1 Tax=Methyloceanibacter sp. TaxID=1965321 RepID=UPI002BA8F331|nr:alpha/beta fold hydrolase [Methyloceanibacter sp.]HML91439.1 alpha/beta fold hydrolase [Methyloceanibacter sp.]